MDPDMAWMLERAPAFLLGVGCGALLITAFIQARRERALQVSVYRLENGEFAEPQRRRVAEGAR